MSRWNVGDRVMALEGGDSAQFTAAEKLHAMRIPAKLMFMQPVHVCEACITACLNVILLGGLINVERVFY